MQIKANNNRAVQKDDLVVKADDFMQTCRMDSV